MTATSSEDPVFILSVVLSTIGMCFSVGTLTFNIYYRQTRLIKMSSPNLNAVVNLGSMVAYCACLMHGLEGMPLSIDSLLCKVRICLLPVAFSLVFGPLFAKSWRVRRIFQPTTSKRVVIKDGRLLLVVFLFVMLDAGILTAWLVLDPVIAATAATTTEIRGSDTQLLSSTTSAQTQCWSPYAPVWMSSLAAIKVVMLLYGLYLAWTTRDVCIPMLNESPCITGSALTTLLLGSLLQALSHWLQHLSSAPRACAVVGIWTSTTVALALLYVPKIYHWWRNTNDEVMKLTFTHASQAYQNSANGGLNIAENKTYDKVVPKIDTKANLDDPGNDTQLTDLGAMIDDTQKDSGIEAECSSGSQNESAHTGSGENLYPLTDETYQYKPSDQHLNHRFPGRGNHSTMEDPARLSSLYSSRLDVSGRGDSWALPVHLRTKIRAGRGQAENGYHGSHPHRRKHRFSSTRLNPGDSVSDIELEIDTPRSSFRGSRRGSTDHLRVHDYPGRHSAIPDTPTRSEIAGSIVQSFDLEEDLDTYSYISHRLSVPHLQYCDNNGYTTDPDDVFPVCSDMSSSRESLSTIANDSYYPYLARLRQSTLNRPAQRAQHHHPHEPPNLYFIKMQPPPSIPHVPSGVEQGYNYWDDSTEV